MLTTDASVFPRLSAVVVWFCCELAVGGAGAGAPGLWLYCNDAGEGAPVPPDAATAALPLKVDIGGKDAALVTVEPRIGAGGSPLGDIAEYDWKMINNVNQNIE